MAGTSVTVTGFNHWPQTAAGLQLGAKQALKQTAKAIQRQAKSGSPVDTGFLRDSIYATGSWGSDYGQATLRIANKLGTGKTAKTRRKHMAYAQRHSDLLPSVVPGGEWEAIVGVAALYGIYVEMGTRKMAAQPYFIPAVEYGRIVLDAILPQILTEFGVSGITGSIGIETI